MKIQKAPFNKTAKVTAYFVWVFLVYIVLLLSFSSGHTLQRFTEVKAIDNWDIT